MKARRLWPVCGLVLLAACGDATSGPAEPSITVSIAPGTVPALLVGDDVTLTASVTGSGPLPTWSSSSPSVATVDNGSVEARRPGTTWVVATAGGAADSVSVTVNPRPGGYDADAVDYFLEIAFGFEFGNVSKIVRKWQDDIRIRVNGNPNQEDLETLEAVLIDINELTSTVDMLLVDDEPMVELHFAPQSQFPSILSSYTPGNVGYFSLWWDASQHFTRGVVLISTDIDQDLRDHIIREEVTQTLGLAQDSYLYSASIFYQAFSTVTEYTAVDEAVIEILYRQEVLVGMGQTEAGRVVRKLTREGQAAPVSLRRTLLRAGTGMPGNAGGSGGGRRP